MSPPVSRAQARYMRAVAAGKIAAPGLTKRQAAEYVRHAPTKNLPEHVQNKKGRR